MADTARRSSLQISITDTPGEGDTRGHEHGIKRKTNEWPKPNIALLVWVWLLESLTQVAKKCGGSPCFLTSEWCALIPNGMWYRLWWLQEYMFPAYGALWLWHMARRLPAAATGSGDSAHYLGQIPSAEDQQKNKRHVFHFCTQNPKLFDTKDNKTSKFLRAWIHVW